MCRKDKNRNLCQIVGRHLLKWHIEKIRTEIYFSWGFIPKSGIDVKGS